MKITMEKEEIEKLNDTELVEFVESCLAKFKDFVPKIKQPGVAEQFQANAKEGLYALELIEARGIEYKTQKERKELVGILDGSALEHFKDQGGGCMMSAMVLVTFLIGVSAFLFL